MSGTSLDANGCLRRATRGVDVVFEPARSHEQEFVDADGTCAEARQVPGCAGVRADGLDLGAELLAALGR